LGGYGMVWRPHELPPVVLCQLDPGSQPLRGMQKLSRTHQEPALDSLAVATAVTVSRGAAEFDGFEIGSVGIEQGQRWVAIRPTCGVARMVPAHARADVVTETPELGPSAEESTQIVGMGVDGVGVGVPDPEGFVEQALLVGTPQGIVGMVLAVVVERDPIAVVANPPNRGLDVLHATARNRVDKHSARIIAIVSQRSVEQAGERAPVGLDGPKLIVEGTTTEECDGHTHAFKAVARQGAKPIC